jgi:hypothetical protein
MSFPEIIIFQEMKNMYGGIEGRRLFILRPKYFISWPRLDILWPQCIGLLWPREGCCTFTLSLMYRLNQACAVCNFHVILQFLMVPDRALFPDIYYLVASTYYLVATTYYLQASKHYLVATDYFLVATIY